MSIELFYLGPKYYQESGSRIGEFYDTKGGRRDWQFIRHAIDKGETVLIRQANKAEVKIAENELAKLLKEG